MITNLARGAGGRDISFYIENLFEGCFSRNILRNKLNTIDCFTQCTQAVSETLMILLRPSVAVSFN